MSTLSTIVIVLLVASTIPNIYMYNKEVKKGNANPRMKLLIGIDAILVILILAAIFLLR
ncbi:MULTISPECIES: hypothetical protein [unclassified Staphylococcus]|uniref:hypothetical protein n=1 Tax=unclassified Staphylococcus TaxID=91994 RepID=UPI0021CF0F56|nr:MULTISPECIES: hypothetical protein [unclassified Staphylococcus]UXR78042.1 hypothetical protein MUA92_09455 [Staphylococcus sp. IVB6227]UXR82204.1 hypothetical protein MUA51_09160 [Staphylococcus sp. IVB6214]